METLELVRPSMEYDDEIMSLRAELLAARDADDFAGCCNLDEYETTARWLEHLCALENGLSPQVPSTAYMAVRKSDGRVVGLIDLRHHIEHPILGEWGGHMGYSVRPSERGKGYGKQMLRLNLENCSKRGLPRVLVTCSRKNPASERVILANGGIFERETCVGSEVIKRYWIELT